MSSSIVYLSDCTPLYTTLGAPERITSVIGIPLFRSARLEWPLPPNSDKILVDSYIVRYKLTGAPITHVLNEVLVFFPTAIIGGLTNGVSYDFWVVAKNRFGESPHSPTISVVPGSSPSPGQIMRRAFHSTISGDGINDSLPQKVGVEFTPGLTQNGAQSLTFTVKYTLLNGAGLATDISYTQLYSVQTNEYVFDISGQVAINTIGTKGNYIRKELIVPTGATGFQSGNYRFQAFSSNIYGISNASDLSFSIYLYSNTDANNPTNGLVPRFTAPTFASYSIPANGGIVSLDASDSLIRFKWKQYRGIGTGSTGTNAYSGWSYRIQYTDDKDNWYYPPVNLSVSNTAYYPEYTRTYDLTSVGANDENFEYFIDISKNVINGRRYYVRYCVVNAAGDSSEYTQVTTNNLSIVSCIPGKLPLAPPIFRASSADRKVRLYFDWLTRPPSSDLTGGLPVLDYRIERYDVIRSNGNISVVSSPSIVYYNLIGPFFEDTYEIIFNGFEYEYRVFSRNAFGYSTSFSSVRAIPFFPSDVVRNVSSSVGTGQVTLTWNQPETIEAEAPIVEYYIEYKIFTLYNISDIPSGNILGTFSGLTTISITNQDMMLVLVDDTLWDKIPGDPIKIFTKSLALSYTVRDLFNGTAYVFRVAAVTQDVARRKIIGLRKVIASNSPYLPRPVIVGRVPSTLSQVSYINSDSKIIITWTSTDIRNTEGILRFIVDYDIAPANGVSESYSQRQTFDYNNSVVFNDNSTTVSFQITVGGLSNNVTQRPDSRMNSYVMAIYAENSVGYTNEENKVKLHRDIILTDIYENVEVRRVVRPRTKPSFVTS
jgi:hypothetical protein